MRPSKFLLLAVWSELGQQRVKDAIFTETEDRTKRCLQRRCHVQTLFSQISLYIGQRQELPSIGLDGMEEKWSIGASQKQCRHLRLINRAYHFFSDIGQREHTA